jgi:hypothetical protein
MRFLLFSVIKLSFLRMLFENSKQLRLKKFIFANRLLAFVLILNM